tara:strand:+ start:1819 stop:2421 length:603 start_codon:yes stop_codon:yes gene_type:complete
MAHSKIDNTFNGAMDKLKELSSVFRDGGKLEAACGDDCDLGGVRSAFEELMGAMREAHTEATMEESINEGGIGNIHAMISSADDPAEMVMDLVDKGDAIGNYLYGELEQLAIEAGKTFNNAESMPEDFVDELLYNMGIEESIVDEADIDENAFNQAAAAAARAGKDSFEFGGKTHKTTMKKDTAHKLDDDIDVLKQLAGL